MLIGFKVIHDKMTVSLYSYEKEDGTHTLIGGGIIEKNEDGNFIVGLEDFLEGLFTVVREFLGDDYEDSEED